MLGLALAAALMLLLPTGTHAVTYAPDVDALVTVLQLCVSRTSRLMPYDPCGHAPTIPAWPG